MITTDDDAEDDVPPEPQALTVAAADAGQRLDRWLAQSVEGSSRERLKALILAGHVRTTAGTLGDPAYRVKPGEIVTVTVPPLIETVEGEPIPLAIVFEDAHLIVIDKPAGLVVHPASGHASGTLVNALIAHCGASLSGIGGVRRPGIVHRLDKDTSGLLVVAKSDAAHAGLAAQFAAHGRDGKLQRTYLAIAWGIPDHPQGTIDLPLARSAANRTKITVARSGGREAITHYKVVETFRDAAGKPAASLLRFELETGRTHQIRVHLTHTGHPIVADATYGAGFAASARRLDEAARAAIDGLGRQALHAATLGFEHPVTGKPMLFESPLPEPMEALLTALRGKPKSDVIKRVRKVTKR